MLWNAISTLPASIKTIYLAPHFDDAALSVGGIVAQQAEQALIVTVCSAFAPAQLNSFATHLHHQWGGAADPIAERRAEDQRSAALLGAHLLWLDYHDAIYRHDLYNSVEGIFGAVASDDPLLESVYQSLQQLQQQLPHAQWVAPLAIGNHVDHQLVHQVARRFQQAGQAVLWYEDLPYATQDQPRQQRLAELPIHSAQTIDITSTLEQKLSAIAAYASQILELFGDLDTMRSRISNYAKAVAIAPFQAAERLWQMSEERT